MGDFLIGLYPWIKSLHVISVISWMAGLFYLPRLFVHHVETGGSDSPANAIFLNMEKKLMGVIMQPAMIATWVFGLILAFTPGVVDWSAIWPWTKLAAILAMSGFHDWLGKRCKEFQAGTNTLSGRRYRLMNEVPTVLMIIIVVSVIARPF